MRSGNVTSQVMAIFTETSSESSKRGMGQYEIYKKLPHLYSEHYQTSERASSSKKITILLAIENASGLCNETEEFDLIIDRLEQMEQEEAKPLYISLTWNTENRFGGGAFSTAGLKKDGMLLLDYLHNKKIAVDFSHTSDALAFGILDYMDKHSLNIPVIASHSNLRSITDVSRNLPDEIAQEILRRGGIIGLTFISRFIGKGVSQFARHLELLLKWGGERQVCLGADFFFDDDMPAGFLTSNEPHFFEEIGNSSTYPYFLNLLKEEFDYSDNLLKQIAKENFLAFFQRIAHE
jgi:microsomal dipeptidase-like Zn-dependent dipeptidase